MATVRALQELYATDGTLVAKVGDAVELRDDTARWYVERGAAAWPPKRTSAPRKEETKD